MDGALLATNAAQLRTLLSDDYLDKPKDPRWIVSIVFVSGSLLAQLIILILLGVLANNNLANRTKKSYLNVMNDVVLVLSGIIFALNVYILFIYFCIHLNEMQQQKQKTV